ncbi:MAG: O-antigen ligase family protein [Candidatus Thiodiazotropha sp. (ex Monitilora ramsayi)]|nr:O-antigen ligase family protein [Candidatus Thiodiazotropha sp. (ex Monitilora ramsayi)]
MGFSLPAVMQRQSALLYARYLLLFELVAIMFSPPLAVLAELLLYLMFVFSRELRNRLILSFKQPLFVTAVGFGVVLIVGVFYSIESFDVSGRFLWGWRKLLMVIMAIAVFDEVVWKRKSVWLLVVLAAACGIASYVTYFLDIGVYKYLPGIIIRNHAAQGMFFSVAAFAAIMLLMSKACHSKGSQYILLFCATILFCNVIFVTPGRSGYLALLVLIAVAVFYFFNGWRKWLLLLSVPSMAVALLMVSPVANQRINQAIDEVMTYQTASGYSSLGARMVMLENTKNLVIDRPLLGYGTGGFEKAYSSQLDDEVGWRNFSTGDPHNQFLKIIVEHGIIGLMVFVGFIAAFFMQKIDQPWRVIGGGVLLAWCATSMFSSHFSTFSEGRFILLWMGMMGAMPLPIMNDENVEEEVAQSP